jgi:hypothetical protein
VLDVGAALEAEGMTLAVAAAEVRRKSKFPAQASGPARLRETP